MVDPDAPSPEEPVFAEFLHWIVDDIPSGALHPPASSVAVHLVNMSTAVHLLMSDAVLAEACTATDLTE
jgi:phosphatidylethanolamine-binding protein (PEBP) family uncharacterized protein